MEDTIHHMRDDVRDLRRSVFATRGRTIIEDSTFIPHTTYRSTRTSYNSGSTIRVGGLDGCDLNRRRGANVYRGYDPYGGGALQINGKNMSFRIRF